MKRLEKSEAERPRKARGKAEGGAGESEKFALPLLLWISKRLCHAMPASFRFVNHEPLTHRVGT